MLQVELFTENENTVGGNRMNNNGRSWPALFFADFTGEKNWDFGENSVNNVDVTAIDALTNTAQRVE